MSALDAQELTITHDALDGTLLLGTERGDGTRLILRTYGMRWGRQIGAWYMPHSRARDANMPKIEALAAALRTAGFIVAVEIEEVSVADAEQARAQLAQSREASLHSRAQRHEQRAAGAHAAAHAVLGAIPPGQPILVGHHSERRHRRDLSRADRALQRAAASEQAASAAHTAARAAASTQAQRESLPSIGRRLERLRAEAAALERSISGTPTYAPAAGDYLARLTSKAARVADELAYWTQKRDEVLAATGTREWCRDDFVIGDRILTAKGLTATVRRVNAKTLTVRFDVMPSSITNPVRYYDVADRLTRHDPDTA